MCTTTRDVFWWHLHETTKIGNRASWSISLGYKTMRERLVRVTFFFDFFRAWIFIDSLFARVLTIYSLRGWSHMSTTTFKKIKILLHRTRKFTKVHFTSPSSIFRPLRQKLKNNTWTFFWVRFPFRIHKNCSHNQFHGDVSMFLRASRSERSVVKWTLLALLLTRRGKFTVRLICENLRTYSRCNARANFTVTRSSGWHYIVEFRNFHWFRSTQKINTKFQC